MVEVEGTFEQASASGMIAVSSGAVTDFSVHEVVDLNAMQKLLTKLHLGTKSQENNFLKMASGCKSWKLTSFK